MSSSSETVHSVEMVHIAVPARIAAVAQRAVGAGEYASVSDVVSEALMDWSRERVPHANNIEDLRRLWQEAIADDSPGIPYEEVMDELKPRCRQMVDASGAHK